MTDSPSGPVHTRETGLEHAPDTQITPRSKHPHLLRLEQRAPSGAGVKDLRPLTRSASGRSLTPTPQFGAPKTWRNRPKERSANPRKALDRPHSFRDDHQRNPQTIQPHHRTPPAHHRPRPALVILATKKPSPRPHQSLPPKGSRTVVAVLGRVPWIS